MSQPTPPPHHLPNDAILIENPATKWKGGGEEEEPWAFHPIGRRAQIQDLVPRHASRLSIPTSLSGVWVHRVAGFEPGMEAYPHNH